MANILVIDDDPTLRSFLRMALEEAGHRVREASDGDTGIKAFSQQAADVVVCDIVMDGKEGLETIMELRRRFGEVKIIAISGGACGGRVDFLPIAAKLGACKFLPKPFATPVLVAAVDEVLNAPQCV
jgi:DNA-binding NtrC family response regulator